MSRYITIAVNCGDRGDVRVLHRRFLDCGEDLVGELGELGHVPEMDGYTFLVELRGKGCKTPFGFVTSESTPDMMATARNGGANFLISKPFTAETFRDTLEAAGV